MGAMEVIMVDMEEDMVTMEVIMEDMVDTMEVDMEVDTEDMVVMDIISKANRKINCY